MRSSSSSSRAATGTREGSNGNVYTDLGFQSGWDVTRGQSGATGILVDYAGGDVAGGFQPSTPYSNAATNPQVTTYAKSVLAKLERVFPGITKQWNGKASLSTPFLDPNLRCSYSYWRVGQYTSFSGYEGVRAGQHPLRRRALLAGLPGIHGRRRSRRRARGGGGAGGAL